MQIAKKRSGISPIIATLLLILIAIASGVVVYAYVIGFVGNSTSNTGGAQSVLELTNACLSVSSSHCNGGSYFVIAQNVGSTTLSSGKVLQIYFQDVTNPTTSTISCPLTSSLPPGSAVTLPNGCSSPSGSSPNVSLGDILSIKVVAADGGSATVVTRVIS